MAAVAATRQLLNEPAVRSEAELELFESERARIVRALQERNEHIGLARAYTFAYGYMLDALIVRALAALLARGPERAKDRRGYVYAFADLRERDQRLLKIGMTTRDVYKRVAEWASELDDEKGVNVVTVFSYRARWAGFCEALVHTALQREHAPDRVAVRSNRALTEYFYVGGAELIASTKYFVKNAAALVNQLYPN